MNINVIKLLLKCLALFLMDIIILLVVFNVWTLANFTLFPIALAAILASLAFTNLAIFFSSKIESMLTLPSALLIIVSTAFLQIFVLVFTALTFAFIAPKTYIIFTLLIFLGYLLIAAGLFLAGINKAKDLSIDRTEKEKTQDIKRLMMETQGKLDSLKNGAALDQEGYHAIKNSCDKAFERINASTPFGRCDTTVIAEQEQRIVSAIEAANIALSAQENIDVSSMVSAFEDIYNLTMNKEKLIVQ